MGGPRWMSSVLDELCSCGLTSTRPLQVGSSLLIAFVSFLGSRVHRPRFIGGGALLAGLASLLMALPHFLGGPYQYTAITVCKNPAPPLLMTVGGLHGADAFGCFPDSCR